MGPGLSRKQENPEGETEAVDMALSAVESRHCVSAPEPGLSWARSSGEGGDDFSVQTKVSAGPAT